MRQDDTWIGEEAAPVAGMVPAFAQIDDQLDRVGAARAEKDRRPVRRDARTVRSDQQVRPQQPMLVLNAKFMQPRGTDLLSHLDQDFDVEAQTRAITSALGEHRGERRDVDAVLPLVVGRAATVEARAFDGDRPRREARPPQIVEAAHGVAVAVDQQGEQRRILDPLRHQEWRTFGVVEHARGESERGEARHHLVVEIAA